jgi:hypothetical protein
MAKGQSLGQMCPSCTGCSSGSKGTFQRQQIGNDVCSLIMLIHRVCVCRHNFTISIVTRHMYPFRSMSEVLERSSQDIKR